MKNLMLYALVATAALIFGCNEENLNPDTNIQDNQSIVDQGDQRVVSEIKVGDKTLTFFAKDGHVGILEKYRPGDEPILGQDFEGLTFSEIHEKLAPGVEVPVALSEVEERFEMKSENVKDGYENQKLGGGGFREDVRSDAGARQTGLNDVWFRDNYCNPSSFYNGYKACLLNRYGPGTDWAWSNCSRSRVYVYPFQGGQIHLQGKINGSTLFDADLLAGWVYTYYMYSGKSFWGCRQIKQHYYSITNTSGDGWHWSLRSNMDC